MANTVTYASARAILEAKIAQFEEKYKLNPCKTHNKYYHQDFDCYGTHNDYWYEYELTEDCNEMCKECIVEYVKLIGVDWKNSILSNLCDNADNQYFTE